MSSSNVPRLAALCLVGAMLAGSPAAAATFTVDNTGDAVDAAPGNGTCATAGAVCTLRAAIMEANALAGPDTIRFVIMPAGAKTISPGSALPNITGPVTIDGTTQPGFVSSPIIEIAGNLAGAGVSGLTLTAGASSSTIRGLVINRFAASGIVVTGSNNNVIERCYLGTNVAGTAALGNGVHGVQIFNNSSNNTVGSTAAGAGNVISGNAVNGVNIIDPGSTGNLVLGNIVGLDAAGNADIGNVFVGVAIGVGANGNFIGDGGNGRNIISGNNQHGVRIVDANTSNNVVRNNFIGLDMSGTAARGNSADGVRLEAGGAASGNLIGTTTAGHGNVISGNGGVGITILNFITSTTVVANRIGTNLSGTGAIPNAIGVRIDNSTNNTIGGTTSSARNVISGNTTLGVEIRNAGSTGNVLRGNHIGLNAAGTAALANGSDGVSLTASAANNQIGGSAAGAGNRIAFNTGRGIVLRATSGSGNAILSNEIHSNGGIGIDLNDNGVTANDPGDVDAGPNALLNFPFVTSVQESGGTLTAYFQLDVPAASYRIELFKNPSGADPSGNGEGETFAASRTLTHPGGGSMNFTHTFAGAVGDVITATTTHCTDGAACTAFGNSSEFSGAITAVTTAVKLTSFTATPLLG